MDEMLPVGMYGAVEAVEASAFAIDYIAQNLRPDDARELHASTGQTDFAHLLKQAARGSDEAVVLLENNTIPIAILGVGSLSLLYNAGCPWMVGTPAVNKHRRAYISLGRFYTARMRQRFDILTNYVDTRNRHSVAWLQRLGYQMAPAAPYGPFGLPFHQFQLGE